MRQGSLLGYDGEANKAGAGLILVVSLRHHQANPGLLR